MNNLRLKHGLFWRWKFPTPWDYPRLTKLTIILAMVTFVAWLWTAYDDLVKEHAKTVMLKSNYFAALLNCVSETGTGFQIGNELFACKGYHLEQAE
jgi:hypothetical protein